ncbi:inner membrane protein [Pontibacter ummariensis]|uniref:Inner membrane protein n=1 Tax=Pontibacter ummariensis TaxID=1610492 RepID=A0A239BR77_9BACT|nr:metal-dependent hydrolase [Pontibacter ummariensis]PRY15667.1 inner membrane protein [Pontibacter ummariensis]SNS10376.1 inner membrane protein [Pontibacter ummariensis]
MDSLTQIVLGASVGEAVAGKKLGNKALLWGAIAGTVPDLDVLLSPWLDTVQELSFHRSVTHSFLFALLVSPLLAWLLRRFYKREQATFRDWTLLFFLGFTTHALLDSCTTWGTQLLWPFTDYGIAFYNIFVVDPLYTVPFLVFVTAAAFYPRHKPIRRYLNYAGLGISSAYLLFSFIAKASANEVFEKALQEQDISYSSYISKPTPLNTLFWAITVKSEEGFYHGFYSLLDADEQISYTFEPQQAYLLAPYRGSEKLERLLEISKGYYAVREAAEGGVLVNDLRFGMYDGWREEGGQYVFVYHVWQNEQGELEVEEINNRPKVDQAYLLDYWDRIRGLK